MYDDEALSGGAPAAQGCSIEGGVGISSRLFLANSGGGPAAPSLLQYRFGGAPAPPAGQRPSNLPIGCASPSNLPMLTSVRSLTYLFRDASV